MGWFEWDDNSELTIGDEAWDIMGKAIEELTELYEKTWGRKPYLEEIVEIFMFAVSPRDFKIWYMCRPEKPITAAVAHILTTQWNDPELYKKLVGEED